MFPQTIGRYEIKAELGRGGMATVYRAYDPRFKRDVALKMLPREFMHDPQFRARFEREAEIIAGLEHPAIVPVYDFGEDAETGQPYIVMRLMTGGSLADHLTGEPLSIQYVVKLFNHIAPALDRAHTKGIVHRDLKPGNILFDEDRTPYISDFGIAKISAASTAFTSTGGIVGTPAYMSPEQGRGDKTIDGRSDIYALGAIVFQMLTGQLPYDADTPMGLAIKHITEPVPDIQAVRPDLPDSCAALIRRAMAKHPNERFANAIDLARDLATLTVSRQPSPYRPAEPTRAARGVSTRKPESISAVPVPSKSRSTSKLAPIVLLVFGVLGAVTVLGLVGVFVALTIVAQNRSTQTAIALVAAHTSAPVATTAGASIAVATQIEPTKNVAVISTATASTQNTKSSTKTLLPSATATPLPTATRKPTTPPTQPPTATSFSVVVVASATASPAAHTIKRVYGQRIDNQAEIFVEYTDGVVVNVTNNPAQDDYPDLSPDGTRIVFASTRTGPAYIFVMNIDGSGVTQLTSSSSGDIKPQWSPDGARIAYQCLIGSHEICVMNAKGSGQVNLTNNAAIDGSPAWSADGTQIYFDTNREGGNTTVRYVMNADGSNVARAP